MNVKIWDNKAGNYITKTNVKKIYISHCSLSYFKLDDKEYDSNKYQLQFIFGEGDKK